MNNVPKFISISSIDREVANYVYDGDKYITKKEAILTSEIWSKLASIMTKIDKQRDGEFILFKISSGIAIMVTLIERNGYNMRIPFAHFSNIDKLDIYWESEAKILTFIKESDGTWKTEFEMNNKYGEEEIKKIFYQVILEEGYYKKQKLKIDIKSGVVTVNIRN